MDSEESDLRLTNGSGTEKDRVQSGKRCVYNFFMQLIEHTEWILGRFGGWWGLCGAFCLSKPPNIL